MLLGLAGVTLVSSITATALAQQGPSADRAAPAGNYWRHFAFGFGASILAHETAHVLTSIAVGAHPYIAFDNGRPTVFSGIDSNRHPHKQFLFSAAGLTTQALINEAILDVPHSRGGAIERGILAGGIATTLFYITLGRNGSASDIAFMARTSSLSKTQLSLIFGGVSAVHAWRVSRDPRYAHFFVGPGGNGAAVGLSY
ncbi:MAG: hypothetical protein M3P26_03270 [Gemmatimonadota bacterium]|nr:hypothetical protein [Gemmatimonadota bacterium]